MFHCIRQHPRLFTALFIIPLVWWVCWLQAGSETELAKYHVVLPHVPVRISLAAEGFALGCIHGLISISIACLLFNIFSKWTYLGVRPVLYAVCWLIPFCSMALFGWAMSGAMPGAIPPPTPVQRTIASWEGSVAVGLFGGVCGLIAFALTQVPWFRRKPLLACLVLFVASWITNGLRGLWLLFTFQYHLHGVPYGLISMVLALVTGIANILAFALLFLAIASWFQNRKKPMVILLALLIRLIILTQHADASTPSYRWHPIHDAAGSGNITRTILSDDHAFRPELPSRPSNNSVTLLWDAAATGVCRIKLTNFHTQESLESIAHG